MRNTAHELLKTKELAATENRVLVLAALLDSTHPMSAREVFETTTKTQTINRVTVYRILDLLADRGLISRISSGERSYRYCAHQDQTPHCHFHCLSCNEILCIENEAVTRSEQALKGLKLDIRDIDLRLDGICPTCRAKGAA